MRDGNLTRKRLEKCALALFVEKGVHATTIKDISQKTGIAEGTLYRHYASKEKLAEGLFLKAYEEISAEMKKRAEESPTLKEKLKSMVYFFCDQYDKEPILFRYLLLSQHYQMETLKSTHYSVHIQLASIMKEAIEHKELPKQDPDFCASIALGIVLQAALSRVYGRISRKMGEDAEALFQAISRALM